MKETKIKRGKKKNKQTLFYKINSWEFVETYLICCVSINEFFNLLFDGIT